MATETTFGGWLRQQRRRLDWTQVELAQRVGYSVATIRKLERDELRPSKHLAELLAQELDVAVTQHASLVSFARATSMPLLKPEAQPLREPRRSNLPAQLTPFFGRTAEIIELTQHLINPIARLITIVGPGGMGKTRLALEVAQAILGISTQTDSTDNPKSKIQNPKFSDGVYFVALAPLRAPEHIVPAIAEAIDLRFQASSHLPKAQLLDYLRHKQVLLVLDNFEHLQAGAELILELLQECSGLRLLLTSREHLHLNSETLFELEGLALPATATLPDVLSYSAVQLFIETARRPRPTFTLTPANAQAIVRICQLVGGMPLGIVLAAAWVEVLSPAEIVTELSQSFDFLAAELRDLPERQRSMRAVLTQSWQRLTDAERAVFMHLAVFRGGFTREAAEQVAGAALPLLLALIVKSLVRQTGSRYYLHEVVRQYAYDKLLEFDEGNRAHTQHLLYFLRLAEQADLYLCTAEQLAWLDRLEADLSNIDAALAWAFNSAENNLSPIASLRLAGALAQFCELRGYLSEGRAYLDRALAMEVLTVNQTTSIADYHQYRGARAKVLYRAASLAMCQNDMQQAPVLAGESLDLCREIGDEWGIAFCLFLLGLATFLGSVNQEQAKSLLTESLMLFRKIGDKRGIAYPLEVLGYTALRQGDYKTAVQSWDECLALVRATGDRVGIAQLLHEQAYWSAYRQADYAHARTLLEESLVIFHTLGNRFGSADALLNLGLVAQAQGDYPRARGLYEESHAIFQELGWKNVNTLLCLGCLAMDEGDTRQAQLLLEKSLAVGRELGVLDTLVDVLVPLAVVVAGQGDYARAWTLLVESLLVAQELKDSELITKTVDGFARLAVAQDQPIRAAHLFGATEVMWEALGLAMPPTMRTGYEHSLAIVRTQINETEFMAAWTEGHALTLDEAIHYALTLGDAGREAIR